MNKRSADSPATKEGSAKKAASAPKQQSLLSWAKPKVVATDSTTAADGDKDSSDATAVAPLVPKAKPDILKGLSDEKRELLTLEQETIDATWLRALQTEFTKAYFIELKKFLKQEDIDKQKIFPPKNDIYSWSRFTPLPTVRVVILGQGRRQIQDTLIDSPFDQTSVDPYHDDNQAHGLCFSVKKPVRPPPSLKNMFKLLETDYPGFVTPNHGYLESWARQGVLMVNAAMTVRAHKANSHKGKGWEKLLDAVIKTVSDQRRNVVFLCWGKDAQDRSRLVDKKKHLVLQSVHPSPLSAHRGFFDSQHFSKANKYLVENGQPPINWNSLVEDSS
ncbi:uracil DNA glycosylase [Linnemannia zychae]|nr:uracil DNA glycosylase [Linnemannia zychae]